MLGRVDRQMGASAGWFGGNPNQTLLERVGKLTTRMIIPGLILLGVYYVAVRLYYSYEAPAKREIKPYNRTCQEAIDFARKALANNPLPIKFNKTYEPINQQIAQLQTVYNAREKEIRNILLNQAPDTWEDPNFCDKVNEAMSIAYTISCWTLEELKDFQETLKKGGVERTLVECLTKADSYQYLAFYECTQLYHRARGRYRPEWNEAAEENRLVPSNPIPVDYEKKFYNGSGRENWRILYNDFCDRVRMYVDERELARHDNNRVLWTKRDDGKETFQGCPATLPRWY